MLGYRWILRPRPIRRAKVSRLGHWLVRKTLAICGVQEDCVAPPVWERVAWIADGEEDDDACKGSAKVDRCSEDVVVLGPPREELRAESVVKCDYHYIEGFDILCS